MNDDDVIIIGGGHNGLTCACYLAAAGQRVRVLERRPILGGAAVTEEFFPGFRNSSASYTVSLLHPQVVRDLRLAEHGLRIVERPFSNFVPLPDGGYFRFGGGLAATQDALRRFSERDAARLPEFLRTIDQVADLLRPALLETPPNVDGGWRDLLSVLRQGRRFASLDAAARRASADLLTGSVGDMLDAWFESDAVKAPFGFDSIVGNFASPYTAGSAYVLLHHALGEVNGKRGAWGHAIGGMGAITQAMAAEAGRRGVVLSTQTPVARLLVSAGRATGVVLANGDELTSTRVVAAVNPKLLFLDLVDPSDLDEEFLRRMRAYRCASGTLRMNVALAQLPDFSCLPGTTAAPHHSAGIILAPSLGYMDRAYHDAVREGWAREPIVEMLIPSTLDTTLAPAGAHVASLFCQHFNPRLPDGVSWKERRDAAADLVVDCVNRYAPNFKASILGRRILSPDDLEQEFGLTGGDIFHGALNLGQLYSLRPAAGYADYRTPIRGLYLCGAGAHPGGGVTGLPGHNAATEILRDVRRRRNT